jgi:hypothetical protein
MKKLRPQKKTSGKNLVTTLQQYSDDIIERLIFKYLKSVYPISRTKFDGKFKRTIMINGNTYAVSQSKQKFVPSLIKEISDTFAINQSESKIIIFNYFKIKPF